MTRTGLTYSALLATAVAGLLAYSWNRHSDDRVTPSHVAETASTRAAPESKPSPSDEKPQQQPDAPAISASMVAKLAADASGSNADARAAAIVALASAPKAQAVPVLSSVLSSGEPQVDRQLAVGSLRAIALDQGDEDGAIREILRDAIYHGDDTDVSLGAQSAVGDIDSNSGQVVQRSAPQQ